MYRQAFNSTCYYYMYIICMYSLSFLKTPYVFISVQFSTLVMVLGFCYHDWPIEGIKKHSLPSALQLMEETSENYDIFLNVWQNSSGHPSEHDAFCFGSVLIADSVSFDTSLFISLLFVGVLADCVFQAIGSFCLSCHIWAQNFSQYSFYFLNVYIVCSDVPPFLILIICVFYFSQSYGLLGAFMLVHDRHSVVSAIY